MRTHDSIVRRRVFLMAPNQTRELVAWPALILLMRQISGLNLTTEGQAINKVLRCCNGAETRNLDKVFTGSLAFNARTGVPTKNIKANGNTRRIATSTVDAKVVLLSLASEFIITHRDFCYSLRCAPFCVGRRRKCGCAYVDAHGPPAARLCQRGR